MDKSLAHANWMCKYHIVFTQKSGNNGLPRNHKNYDRYNNLSFFIPKPNKRFIMKLPSLKRVKATHNEFIDWRIDNMVISETVDYEQLVDLFIRNELEFSKDKPIIETDIAKCWKAEKDNELIGGCMLAKREGHYKLDGLAIEPLYRRDNIGSKLLHNALNYIKEQGGHSLYLVAKVPEFYLKHGFRIIDRAESPITVKCFTCSQYNTTCFPQVMKIDIHNATR